MIVFWLDFQYFYDILHVSTPIWVHKQPFEEKFMIFNMDLNSSHLECWISCQIKVKARSRLAKLG